MLNLLRCREEADYADSPLLAPPSPISGRDAYDLYIRHTIPFLNATGGSLEARAAVEATRFGSAELDELR